MSMNRSNCSNRSSRSKRITFGMVRSFGTSRTSSFTLIEILVAVGIIAIIMVLVISLIVSIIHFNYKMSLQRQINREARNIMEMIVREGRLARGATGTPSEPAIQIGHLEETGVPPKLTFSGTSGNNAINFREVPQLGRSFGLYPLINGSLNIINQPYTVTGTPTADTADIMIVLDQSGSIMEPYSDDVGPEQPCMTTADGAAYGDFQIIVSNADADYFKTDPGGAGFGCRDLGGNGSIQDEFEQTKYFKSREVIRQFLAALKVVEDTDTTKVNFRVGVVVFARNIVDLVSSSSLADGDASTPGTPYYKLYHALNPDKNDPDSKQGVAGNTATGPALERGFNNLTGSTADHQIEVFITDGKGWLPKYSNTNILGYPSCSYTDATPLPSIDLTGKDLRDPIYAGGVTCQIFAREYAWQMSQREAYSSPLQKIETYVAGYGKASSIASMDAPLLNSMAHFGSCLDVSDCTNQHNRDAYLGSNLQQLFDDIGGVLNQITYSAGTSLGTPTSSATLFQVSTLSFTTNNDKTWVEITMEMKTPDYDLPTIPSWQKAKISLRTVFTTRAYP